MEGRGRGREEGREGERKAESRKFEIMTSRPKENAESHQNATHCDVGTFSFA